MRINACTKTYGGRTVLRFPGLSLEPGSICAVVGANGSGKSTFARLVSGAVRPDGNVQVLESPVRVGYMPQKSFAFRLTVRRNIRLSGPKPERAEALMEALGLTPKDFDLARQTLTVDKTWDYKNGGGFVPTKNASSVRKVQLDWQLTMQFAALLKDLPTNKPIFVEGKVYNSTANNVLARHCRRVGVPVISVHGLRHTHASLLLYAGVSIASVSKRLGHASMNTTQDTYLHVIRELENKDVDIIMRALSTLI